MGSTTSTVNYGSPPTTYDLPAYSADYIEYPFQSFDDYTRGFQPQNIHLKFKFALPRQYSSDLIRRVASQMRDQFGQNHESYASVDCHWYTYFVNENYYYADSVSNNKQYAIDRLIYDSSAQNRMSSVFTHLKSYEHFIKDWGSTASDKNFLVILTETIAEVPREYYWLGVFKSWFYAGQLRTFLQTKTDNMRIIVLSTPRVMDWWIAFLEDLQLKCSIVIDLEKLHEQGSNLFQTLYDEAHGCLIGPEAATKQPQLLSAPRTGHLAYPSYKKGLEAKNFDRFIYHIEILHTDNSGSVTNIVNGWTSKFHTTVKYNLLYDSHLRGFFNKDPAMEPRVYSKMFPEGFDFFVQDRTSWSFQPVALTSLIQSYEPALRKNLFRTGRVLPNSRDVAGLVYYMKENPLGLIEKMDKDLVLQFYRRILTPSNTCVAFFTDQFRYQPLAAYDGHKGRVAIFYKSYAHTHPYKLHSTFRDCMLMMSEEAAFVRKWKVGSKLYDASHLRIVLIFPKFFESVIFKVEVEQLIQNQEGLEKLILHRLPQLNVRFTIANYCADKNANSGVDLPNATFEITQDTKGSLTMKDIPMHYSQISKKPDLKPLCDRGHDALTDVFWNYTFKERADKKVYILFSERPDATLTTLTRPRRATPYGRREKILVVTTPENHEMYEQGYHSLSWNVQVISDYHNLARRLLMLLNDMFVS